MQSTDWTRRNVLKTGLLAVASPWSQILPAWAEDAKKPAKQAEAQSFLFLDWFHVQKGDLRVSLDPARISPEGKKLLETYKRDFQKNFDQEGHKLIPSDVPYGIRIEQEVAQHSEPWLKADQPWERAVSGATVIHENGKYRCWYQARLVGEAQETTVAQGQVMEFTGSALAYAESEDGLNWKKPVLNVLSFKGSKANNLVSPFNNGGGVFVDEHGTAEERYKGFQFDKLPPDQLGKGNFGKYGLYGVTSPDGYHWKKSDKPLIRYFCDTQNIAAWDPVMQKYVGYYRHHLSGRTISRAETEDFWNWPEPQPLLYAGPLDSPADDYYTNCYTTYPGQLALRLLFPAIYHRANDSVDVRLAVSRDGRSYQWVSYAPIIKLGGAKDSNAGSIYAEPNLVRLPDGRLALPYDASNITHNEVWFENFYGSYPHTDHISWALWKEDRLAGIVAEEQGQFTTTSLSCQGKQLQINARTSRSGSVEVEVRERGKPVPGFSFAESVPFSGDEIWADCRWKGKENLKELRGKNLQLCIRLRSAKIFACRWV